jgi:hypothetical protein
LFTLEVVYNGFFCGIVGSKGRLLYECCSVDHFDSGAGPEQEGDTVLKRSVAWKNRVGKKRSKAVRGVSDRWGPV